MSKFIQKPGKGSLFVNNRKETDSHPDYTGSLTMPDGKEYWLNCWQNQAGGNGPVFSLSVKEKTQANPAATRQVHKPAHPTTQPVPESDNPPF